MFSSKPTQGFRATPTPGPRHGGNAEEAGPRWACWLGTGSEWEGLWMQQSRNMQGGYGEYV